MLLSLSTHALRRQIPASSPSPKCFETLMATSTSSKSESKHSPLCHFKVNYSIMIIAWLANSFNQIVMFGALKKMNYPCKRFVWWYRVIIKDKTIQHWVPHTVIWGIYYTLMLNYVVDSKGSLFNAFPPVLPR